MTNKQDRIDHGEPVESYADLRAQLAEAKAELDDLRQAMNLASTVGVVFRVAGPVAYTLVGQQWAEMTDRQQKEYLLEQLAEAEDRAASAKKEEKAIRKDYQDVLDKYGDSSADLTAARAGEARAVEALRKIAENTKAALKAHNPDVFASRGKIEPGYCEALANCADDLDYAISELDAQPAIDWLAQQRREAAAEALEEVAKLIRQTNPTPYGGDVAPFEIGKWEGRQYAAEQIEARAAELRKGKGE